MIGGLIISNANNMLIKQPSKLVAVVVPLSNRKELTPEEEISLRHRKTSRSIILVLGLNDLTINILEAHTLIEI